MGTVQATTAGTQAVEANFATDAWGNPISGSAADNPFVYLGGLGYWQEPTLGLDYVRARWLYPATGTWLSVDPVPTEPRYSYAHNSPSFRVDPSGRQTPGGGGVSSTDPLDVYNEVYAEKSGTANPFAASIGASAAAFGALLSNALGMADAGWKTFVKNGANLIRSGENLSGLPVISSELIYRQAIQVVGGGTKTKRRLRYNLIYMLPPADIADYAEWGGGFVAGIAETIFAAYASLPGVLLQAVYELLSGPGQAWKDIQKFLRDQWASLIQSFDQVPNMDHYERGKLFGTLVTSAVLLILSIIALGTGIAALSARLRELIPKLKLAVVLATS